MNRTRRTPPSSPMSIKTCWSSTNPASYSRPCSPVSPTSTTADPTPPITPLNPLFLFHPVASTPPSSPTTLKSFKTTWSSSSKRDRDGPSILRSSYHDFSDELSTEDPFGRPLGVQVVASDASSLASSLSSRYHAPYCSAIGLWKKPHDGISPKTKKRSSKMKLEPLTLTLSDLGLDDLASLHPLPPSPALESGESGYFSGIHDRWDVVAEELNGGNHKSEVESPSKWWDDSDSCNESAAHLHSSASPPPAIPMRKSLSTPSICPPARKPIPEALILQSSSESPPRGRSLQVRSRHASFFDWSSVTSHSPSASTSNPSRFLSRTHTQPNRRAYTQSPQEVVYVQPERSTHAHTQPSLDDLSSSSQFIAGGIRYASPPPIADTEFDRASTRTPTPVPVPSSIMILPRSPSRGRVLPRSLSGGRVLPRSQSRGSESLSRGSERVLDSEMPGRCAGEYVRRDADSSFWAHPSTAIVVPSVYRASRSFQSPLNAHPSQSRSNARPPPSRSNPHPPPSQWKKPVPSLSLQMPVDLKVRRRSGSPFPLSLGLDRRGTLPVGYQGKNISDGDGDAGWGEVRMVGMDRGRVRRVRSEMFS